MLVRDDDIVWRTEEGWWNVCSIFFSSSVLTFFSLLLLSFPIFFTSSPPSLSLRIAPFPLSRPLLTIATSLPPSLSSPHPALLSSPHRISITNPPPLFQYNTPVQLRPQGGGGGSQSYTRARNDGDGTGRRSEEEDVGGDVERGAVFAPGGFPHSSNSLSLSL